MGAGKEVETEPSDTDETPKAPRATPVLARGAELLQQNLEENMMTLQELKTAVIIGWLCPALVILLIAWPKVAALLALAVLAWLACGWWKDLR